MIQRRLRTGGRWLQLHALLALLWLCLPAFVHAQDATGPSPASPAVTATTDADAPRIGVVTMLPGEIFFERFGHDALVVADPQGGQAISYNFGYFDPSEQDFVGRFAQGEMMYYLVALPLQQDLEYYQQTGRGAFIQWLDLDPQQARTLAASLADRARPENARYRYDYYTANCATMVRDAIDEALGGGLHAQLSGRSRGNTYRSESVRLASPSPWMWLGFDLGLGPFADRPLSRWQEAFVPMRLADALRQSRNSEGRPLVMAEQELLPQRLPAEPVEQPRRWWPWLLAGLVLAAGIFAAARRPRLLGAAVLALWLPSAIVSGLLLFLWLASDHVAAWGNRNLWLALPTAVALLAPAISLLRRSRQGRIMVVLAWLPVAFDIAALLQYWLAPQPQYNLPWIVLLLPVHTALAWVLQRRLSVHTD